MAEDGEKDRGARLEQTRQAILLEEIVVRP